MNNKYESCNFCGSENVVFVEYTWAYDGVLEKQCNDCNRRTHLYNEKEIVSSVQKQQYWAVTFTFIDGTEWINRCRENIII